MNFRFDSAIKKEIENIFGGPVVSTKDCIRLAEDIYRKTSRQLNPNTLRRLFGLVKSENSPSVSTLNILSEYCGFQSRGDIEYLIDENPVQEKNADSFILFLVSLFRDVELDDREDSTYISIVQNTIFYLNRNPGLRNRFQSLVAKTINGREIYFEKFVNIDQLDDYYGEGLKYYYKESRNLKARIFTHSLFCFRYWLTEDVEKLNLHIDKLKELELNSSQPLFICGRYWAARLFGQNALGLDYENVSADAMDFYITMTKSTSRLRFPRMELYLAESLVFTGFYEEGLFIINEFKKGRWKDDHYTCVEFHQIFLLLESIALVKTGKNSLANKRNDEINQKQFYFLRKSYCSILHQILSGLLGKKLDSGQPDMLNMLIRETGFTRLLKLLVE